MSIESLAGRGARRAKQEVARSIAKKRRSEMDMGKSDHEDATDLSSPMHEAGEQRAPITAAHEGSESESIPTNPEHSDPEGLSENVMEAERLAEGLQASRMKANDSSVSYEANDSVAGSRISRPGQMQEDHADTMVGNKPDLDFIDDGTEESMSSMPAKPAAGFKAPGEPSGPGLSAEAKQAIARKRASRRYGSYDPK